MNDYLRLDGVSKSYSGKHAVRNVSLSVRQGAILGMIGPNGAGKTTTIRMIMNIIAPDSGRILFKGSEVDDSFRDLVGFLPEERGLYKKMKVVDSIRYMAELKGYASSDWKGESLHWLERMNLGECAEKKVEELSKGMQQKLQFITTVFHKPELIILDELFSGLDPLNIELVKNQLFELRKQGATILFSTHVMEQAEKMCDYIALIRDGKFILEGELADIKSRFGKGTAHIVHSGPSSLVSDHPLVQEVVEFPNYQEAKFKEGADHMELLRELCSKTTVTRFEMVEPSLYNIFIEAAGSQSALDIVPSGVNAAEEVNNV